MKKGMVQDVFFKKIRYAQENEKDDTVHGTKG